MSVVSTLLTGAIVAAIALLSKSVRRAVLYRRQVFELQCSGEPSGCEWDIQWENLRITIDVKKVHNDYIEDVQVKTNERNPGKSFDHLVAQQEYIRIAGPPAWYLRIDSIVRAKAGSTRWYVVMLSVLIRRWRCS